MLVQSHDGAIHLLPALPSKWSSGSVRGLKARGGFIIDMKWKNGRVSYLKVRSTLGGACPIRVDHPMQFPNSGLVEKSGQSSNPFFTVPQIPTPVIVNPAALNGIEEKKVYQYEFSTLKGNAYQFGTDHH